MRTLILVASMLACLPAFAGELRVHNARSTLVHVLCDRQSMSGTSRYHIWARQNLRLQYEGDVVLSCQALDRDDKVLENVQISLRYNETLTWTIKPSG